MLARKITIIIGMTLAARAYAQVGGGGGGVNGGNTGAPGGTVGGGSNLITPGAKTCVASAGIETQCITAISTFVFDGDSITAGSAPANGANSYPSQAAALPEIASRGTVSNVGVAGRTCEQISAAYTAEVHPLSPAVTGKPGYFFLMCGTNNIVADSAAVAYAALQGIWSQAKADGFKVIAMTIPYGSSTSATNVKVDAYNSAIRGGGFPSSNLYDYLIDVNNFLADPFDPLYFQSDHLHPTTFGNTVLARRANDAMSYFGSNGIGENASHYITLGSGSNNVRLSLNSMFNLTTGSNDTAGGESSLQALTTGSDMTGFGYGSCGSAQDAVNGTCIGYLAGNGEISGADFVFIGRQAGAASTATQSVGIGSFALISDTGGNNTAVGYNACGATAAGSFNTCLGASSNTGVGTIGAAVIGAGTNSTNNTLQFQTFNFMDASGNFKMANATATDVGGVAFAKFLAVSGTNQAILSADTAFGGVKIGAVNDTTVYFLANNIAQMTMTKNLLTVTPNISLTGFASAYHGDTTAGNGLGSIVATANATAQGANIGSTLLYTTTATSGGLYEAVCTTIITTADGVSSTLPQCNFIYTDPDTNAASTVTAVATSAGNVIGQLGPIGTRIYLNAKASTAINYSTTGYLSNTASQMKYAVHVALIRIGN